MKTTGQVAGGYGDDQRGYIDFSANVIDHADNDRHIYGIQIQGGILRIATEKISVYKGTSTSATSTECGSGTINYISRIQDNGDGTISWWGNTLTFKNGLMTTSL